MKRPNTRAEADERLLISLGSQGTASLAIMIKMLRAFEAKGLLKKIEVIAILDAAAESAERSHDRLGGKYSTATGAAIRHLLQQWLEDTPEPSKH